MKRKGTIALALTLILAGATALAGPGGKHNREAHMERMSEQLGLDDYQSEQVQSIMREQHEKFRAMGKELRDQGVARDSDEARTLREQAHEETRARLATVLSADQLEQLDEMRQKRQKHGKGHRKHDRGESDEL